MAWRCTWPRHPVYTPARLLDIRNFGTRFVLGVGRWWRKRSLSRSCDSHCTWPEGRPWRVEWPLFLGEICRGSFALIPKVAETIYRQFCTSIQTESMGNSQISAWANDLLQRHPPGLERSLFQVSDNIEKAIHIAFATSRWVAEPSG